MTLAGQPGALLDVVGESQYQDALLRVAGGKTEHGPARQRVIAELVREPRNRFDPNAVAVHVGGLTVGYIEGYDAPRTGHVVEHMWSHGYLATVPATITGGWDRGFGDVGSFGIVLHCDAEPEVWNPNQHPGLHAEARVSLQGEEHSQERLRRLMNEGMRLAWLAQGPRPWTDDDEPAVLAKLDGEVVGALTKKMSRRYLPWLRTAAQAGATLSAWLHAGEGKNKIEAYVSLPKVDD